MFSKNVTMKRANRPRSMRDLCAKPWDHILRIWLPYRMGLAMGLIKNLARFIVQLISDPSNFDEIFTFIYII